MLFGFLMLDLLVWAVLPFIICCFLFVDWKGWALSFTLIVLGIAMFTNAAALAAAVHDPVFIGNCVKYVIGYACLGLLFSFLKWKMVTIKIAREFARFLSENNPTSLAERRPRSRSDDEMTDKQWERVCVIHFWEQRIGSTGILRVVPKAGADEGWSTSFHKWKLASYVMAWTSYWPAYAIFLVLDDFLRNIAEWFVEVFGNAYQRLSDQSFNSIK